MPFFLLSVACFCVSYILSKKAQAESTIEEVDPALPHPSAVSAGAQHSPSGTKGSDPAQATPESSPSSSATMEKAIEQEVFALEMGYGLLILADKGKGDLLERITGARTNFAKEMGMLLPTIGVRDNIELEPNEYRFLLRGKKLPVHQLCPTVNRR